MTLGRIYGSARRHLPALLPAMRRSRFRAAPFADSDFRAAAFGPFEYFFSRFFLFPFFSTAEYDPDDLDFVFGP